MDQNLKQRIVGAVVLVSIAVIFIPMLFEERSELGEFSISETNIPAFPEKQFVEAIKPLPQIEEIEQQSKPPIKESVLASPSVVAEKKEPQLVVSRVVAKETVTLAPTYLIQVASFGKESNAEKLSSRLKNAGYPAFIKSKTDGQRVKYRVVVGPELDKKRAETSKVKIEKKFKLKAMILTQKK
jgi:DedD protein